MSRIAIPDPQHIHYEALVKAFTNYLDAAVEAGELSDYDAQSEAEYYFGREPESVVFFGSDRDDYEDEDDFRETVLAQGGRDLSEKIDYWTRTLENINNPDGE